ncbi:sodium:solute symporter [Rhodobacteraceae bacterium NNCM2]|nr:sodium:solute symporter [Coraliihabitans acroporae]
MSPNIVIMVSIGYVAFLFLVAWYADRQTQAGRMTWLGSPLIYTLSISVYCTSWTFFGAVGSAARNGLEFLTIYLGPTLVFIGWFWLLRKLVRIGREHRITSIADMISSRYGKSPALAIAVTLIAVIATTPYIALQLQAVTRSFEAIAGATDANFTGFWVAAGMAVFTILFGTRTIDANERHHGVVAAIAAEALVKLFALIAVGVFVIFGLAGGVGEVFARMPEDLIDAEQVFGPRWVSVTFLAASAIICLPRQFQVIVVENVDERHLSTASWMFPLYLFLMCLFVLPIAIVGLSVLPAGSNPDLFVLSLPLAAGRQELALLAYIGGFSAATSMVIVASIALSTMISNHIIMPISMSFHPAERASSGDVRNLLLLSRRISIGAVLMLGFLYFRLSGGTDALASIGLIAFAGIAQVMPALLGGIFWRGATAAGALAGLAAGFLLWAYTLFLPSFGGDFLISASVLEHGPWGVELLRPQSLFGAPSEDPLIHALVWSLGLNTLVFLFVSLQTTPRPLERLQGALFVDAFHTNAGSHSYIQRSATPEDLFVLAQRILGVDPARILFKEIAQSQGIRHGLPRATDACIDRLERELAGSVGAASAHAMVSRAASGETISLTDLMDIAGETRKLIETSDRLAEKTAELERTAKQLREVNARLRNLDRQKDDFLAQVSHELRTPMTAIRSFSEILQEPDLTQEQLARFMTIIHDESLRLTRLLDEILDIGRLESGSFHLDQEPVNLGDALRGALATIAPLCDNAGVRVLPYDDPGDLMITSNPDRLRQVLLNILTNAVKYNDAETPEIRIDWRIAGRRLLLDIADNGGGVSRTEAQTLFDKFTRGARATRAQGAGLGLPISRTVMRSLGGDLTIEFEPDGNSFFRLNCRIADIAQAAE